LQKREENDMAHSIVSKTIDETIIKLFDDKNIKIANLGAGANPQKYERILEKVRNNSNLDWVDISPEMLKIAQEKENLPKNIHFITNNFMGYLNSQENNSLDCVFMQYAINYIDNNGLNEFFQALSNKLKNNGVFIANLGGKILKNSSEVNFLINGQEFEGVKNLVSGDRYTIRFLNPDGTIDGSTEKNFFTNEEILLASTSSGLNPKIETINNTEIIIVKK